MLDSDPGILPLDAERDVDSVLKQVERIPLPVTSRQWLLDYMQAQGFSMVCLANNLPCKQLALLVLSMLSSVSLYTHYQSPVQLTSQGLAQWLGSNLVPRSGGLYWAFRIEGAAAMYNSYRINNLWGTVAAPPPGCTLHMVIAERSAK